MSSMSDVSSHLQTLIGNAPNEELGNLFRELDELYSKRLWHQLTGVLMTLVHRPELQSGDQLSQFYRQVIADFDSKLNPLTLVDICKPIVASIKDSKASIDFWEKLSEKIKSHNEEACALAMVQVANVYLHGLKDEGKTKQLIEEIGELVHGFEFVGKVHQEFYLLSSEFAKVQGDYANYYASTLRYLGCLDISTQSPEVNTALALHLSLAALLGNNVFNFGELLAHPILDYLRQSNEKWLLQVLTAFNEGNVLAFQKLKPQWSSLVDLKQKEDQLMEKISLLAVMELSFQRNAKERQLNFQEIVDHTTLPKDKVELLVMKALSKGLIRGQIDQVGESVDVTWVQPRVLNKQQLCSLQAKLDVWVESIHAMEGLIEQNGGEILTH